MSSLIERTKEYIIQEFLDGYPNASFVELERKLKDKGLEEILPKGEVIDLKLEDNIIAWRTQNKILVEACMDLITHKRIKLAPTNAMIYMMDGMIPKIPVLTEKKQMESGREYWLPCVINSAHRHMVQEIREQTYKRNRKEYLKIINGPLAERHICYAGIGYYLKPKATDLIRDVFESVTSNLSKHSKKCEMPERAQVEVCKQFLTTQCVQSDTINHEMSSYGWKHVAERWAAENTKHTYVSNGDFITAAMELGYKVEEDEQPSLNAYFNIDQIEGSKA